tara:strand:+ start:2286 stop:2957 length:672 start_codon:yes stop_codon:yes gene_type:complete
MKKIISALFLMVFASTGYVTTAIAMDFSLGVSGNYAAFTGKGEEKNTTRVTSENGVFQESYPSIFVELGLNDVVDIGLEYTPDTISTPENTALRRQNRTNATGSNGSNVTNTVAADFEDLMYLYMNVNLPWYGLYLKGGWSQVDVITKESLGTGGSYGDVSTDGLMVGFGVAHDMDGGFFVRAEITASEWEDVNATSTAETTKTVKVSEMYSASASLRIGKTF